MTKKIGKIIMITAIVALIVGVVGMTVSTIISCVNVVEDTKKEIFCMEHYSNNCSDMKKIYNKLVVEKIIRCLKVVGILYISSVVLCGYGRLIQDNHEKAQVAKELNDILTRKLKEESQNDKEE